LILARYNNALRFFLAALFRRAIMLRAGGIIPVPPFAFERLHYIGRNIHDLHRPGFA
jgi:hypothetical protein